MWALLPAAAHATLISVSGPLSSLGTQAQIVLAPGSVLDGGLTGNGQLGFDERQGVITLINHAIDGPGFIPEGTLVNSHMIFLDPTDDTVPVLHENVVWTFDGPIIGIMSDTFGFLEASSSFDLGAPGTTYYGPGGAPDLGRGLEAADSYIIAGNVLTLTMQAQIPGDWIRVITEPGPPNVEIPEPGTWALLGAGLMAIGLRRRWGKFRSVPRE